MSQKAEKFGKRMLLVSCLLFSLSLLTSCTASSTQVPSQDITKSSDAWLTNYIEPPKNVSPEETYTFLCEIVVKRPETLTNTCADFGESVVDIKWNKWSVYGSTGIGTYQINDCNPDCSDGKLIKTPVYLSLDRVTFDGKRYLLNILTIRSENAKEESGIYKLWDVGSFYREVPEMRD